MAMRLCAAAFLGAMLALIKYGAQQGLHLSEITFWRQAVTLPMLGGFLVLARQTAKLKTSRIGVHLRRAVFGMAIMATNFFATILLPLAVSTTLSFTTPLFVVIFSAFVLHERIGPWRWGAVVLGLVGVILIADPAGTQAEDISALGLAAGLFTAMMVVVISFQIRDLAQTENTIAMTFYFALFGAPIAALFLPYGNLAHTGAEWAILIGIGVLGTTCQMFLAMSLRFAPVSTVIVMDYSAIVWATLYGWLIWDHLPTAATIVGAPMIMAAGATIVWREARLSKQPSPSSPAVVD